MNRLESFSLQLLKTLGYRLPLRLLGIRNDCGFCNGRLRAAYQTALHDTSKCCWELRLPGACDGGQLCLFPAILRIHFFFGSLRFRNRFNGQFWECCRYGQGVVDLMVPVLFCHDVLPAIELAPEFISLAGDFLESSARD